MLRYLTCVLVLIISTAAVAQNSYFSLSAGLQTYEQYDRFDEITLISNGNNPVFVRQSTARGTRPVFGLQYKNVFANGRMFKLGVQYAAEDYDFNTVTFTTDADGNVTSFEFSEPVGTVQTRLAQLSADYGFPLLKKGENWQFYAAGRAGVQYEGHLQTTESTTVFPTDNEFFGVSVALSPELVYTFKNQKVQIGFNPVVQFFRAGIENINISNPILNQDQSRIESTSLELFGKQPINFDLRIGFRL